MTSEDDPWNSNLGYGCIVLLFVSAGLWLIFFGSVELWNEINPTHAVALRDRLNVILEGIGLLTIAIVALELGQTGTVMRNVVAAFEYRTILEL